MHIGIVFSQNFILFSQICIWKHQCTNIFCIYSCTNIVKLHNHIELIGNRYIFSSYFYRQFYFSIILITYICLYKLNCTKTRTYRLLCINIQYKTTKISSNAKISTILDTCFFSFTKFCQYHQNQSSWLHHKHPRYLTNRTL